MQRRTCTCSGFFLPSTAHQSPWAVGATTTARSRQTSFTRAFKRKASRYVVDDDEVQDLTLVHLRTHVSYHVLSSFHSTPAPLASQVMLGRGAVEINQSIMEKCARIEHLFSLSSEISEVTMLIPDNSPLIRWMKEKGLPVSIAYEIFNVPEIPYDCSLNLPNKTPEEELSDPDKIAAHEKWVMDVVETYYVQIQQHLKTHAVSADEADSGDMDYTAADVVTFQMKFEDW